MIDTVRSTRSTRGIRRPAAAPAVAPMAHAIRRALVASTMALAIAAPLAQAEAGHAAPQLAPVRTDTLPVAVATGSPGARAETAAVAPVVDVTLVADARPASAVHASAGFGIARADDAHVAVDPVTELVIDTDIDVVVTSPDGDATAIGAVAYATELASVYNLADVGAHADAVAGVASAYGVAADGTTAGVGLVINAGDVVADAVATAAGTAYATGLFAYGDVATVFNDGTASASAVSDGGLAAAAGARTVGFYSAASNYGSLTATADSAGGIADARGIDSYGYFGSSVYNAGDIDVLATAVDGVADASGVYSIGAVMSSYTDNTGSIHAEARAGQATANGVVNVAAYFGHAVTTNSGDITAVAVGGRAAYGEREATAFGVYNLALIYGSYVDNSGSISAVAEAMDTITYEEGMLQSSAVGAAALNQYGYFDTGIRNSGDISGTARTSVGFATAFGAAVRSNGIYGGTAWLENTGELSAYAAVGVGVASATAAYVHNFAGDASAVNHGDIAAYAHAVRGIVGVTVDYASATGLDIASGYGATTVANYGDIAAVARADGAITYATGIQASGSTTDVHNAAGATVEAHTILDLFGGGFSTGILAAGTYDVTVVNDGTVIATVDTRAFNEGENGFYGAGTAVGIAGAANLQGDVTIVNNGDVFATSISEDSLSFVQGGAGATGLHAYAKYDAVIVNNGNVFATAQAEFGIVGAYGAIGHGKYSADIVNNGLIVATSEVGSLPGEYFSGRAVAFGTHIYGTDYGSVTNDGTIIAHATATADGTNENPTIAGAWGVSAGAYSDMMTASIVNRGDVEAVASADFGYATANGLYAVASADVTTLNDGDVLASATATGGDALAVGSVGVSVHTDYVVPCDENGCDYGNAYFVVDGGAAALQNAGTLTAIATADGGVATAYGAVVVGGYSASIVNSGDIVAIATGDQSEAIGALVNTQVGASYLRNDGTIVAAAYGADATAVGVQLLATGVATLINHGNIVALGDGERIAVETGVDAIANLHNAGTLAGSVRTGGLADLLSNAGLWFADGLSTFGAGDDRVYNAGTVVLVDSTIDLGDGDDLFANSGTVAADGSNAIDADLFRNDGVVTMVDGATGDVLALGGDFAGTGHVQFDVDGLTGTSDLLTIAGDVAADSVQTLDVALWSRPESATFDIALVEVGGVSAASNFVLGDVAYTGGFVTMDFDLVADIDAAGGDVFSLAAEVTGLSGTGTLAAALSPGVQTLVDAQIGSWRQRMGVLPKTSDGGPDAWIRAFSRSGDLDAAHQGIGGDAGLAIDQSSHGVEMGVDLALNDHVSVGLLAGQSEATSRLGEGVGSNRLDADTFGLYATWQGANGFYVDASQRWTGIEATLRGADVLTTEVDARTFNVEAGFTGWTPGGVGVTPQLQVTHTRIGDISPLHAQGSVYEDDGGDSTRARAGVMFDRTFDAGSALLTPYASLSAVHEFDGDYAHSINGGLLGTTSTDGTAALVELGLGVRAGRLTVTGGVDWTDGGAQDGVVGGQINLRYAW